MRPGAHIIGWIQRLLSGREAWILGGVIATLLGAWIVIARPEEAPHVGGVGLGPALYYLQWVIYAAIIVLLGTRIRRRKRTLTARQDLGFVSFVTVLYTVGFMLSYTPFVYEFPEGPVAGVVRAVAMFVCGILGAVYGLSSTHRWR